ncbi:MAG: hypothetical protein EOP51_21630, partial [Sphingobacteriales bacterium]
MKLLRPLFLFLSLLVAWQQVTAQEVVYSPYDKFDVRTSDFSVVGKVGNRIYTYRGSIEGY